MKFYKSTFAGLFILLLAFGLAACRSEPSSAAGDAESGDQYTIACTVGMITDVVRNVAGEYAEVEGIIGEGVDPHLYKPTRSDVVTLNGADVIFYNGLLLEGKMADVLVQVATSGKPVHAVTEKILGDEHYLMEKEDGSSHTDPHVWMDVEGWLTGVDVIARALAEYDPENAQDYLSAAGSYAEKLKALDDYAASAMATIPEGQRVLVTAHDAFRYMGRAYGLEVRGIQGISTESEAGVRDLEDLIDFIVTRNIPAVFVESSVADKNVRALVEGAKARGHKVRIGGELFSDAMGQPGTYEGTYIGMIDHNVTTIVNALGGDAGGFEKN
ncbi:manganese transporter [Coraliomargarita sinensis]|uniref:Manganese transporter n=1 Tax=Coraliomargarita sinensis TaxID=2174842 RepID=A0A317ZLX5_9BACT|nr:zinc ABC transporter substrate-binding protein [Coraliomargarita sinensis]PXA05233.1 manganese transporter [Coraliomargarita sinensis]